MDRLHASKIKPHVDPAPMPRVAVRFDLMHPQGFERELTDYETY